MNWEEEGHEPYHEYVHQLVDAGWDNLKGLDDYMSEDWEDRDCDFPTFMMNLS
jgi:hypothetical protein